MSFFENTMEHYVKSYYMLVEFVLFVKN